jgi:copper chaperone NosL
VGRWQQREQNDTLGEEGYMKRTVLAMMVALTIASAVLAGEQPPVKPKEDDKCPVCGMFVAKYPDFLAEVMFKDGSYAVFDGTKDMFKYYLNLKRYNQTKDLPDIDSIYVTDYYELTMIDGNQAFYVLGSDVYGPMGKELIPFKSNEDAKEFLSDHAGKSIIKFNEINSEIINGLD